MIRSSWIRWLHAPPITGWPALVCAFAAVGIPTAVRAAVSGVVTGCEFTPYLPFVMLSAILLGWRHAAGVAVASVLILGGLFPGASQAFLEACFISSAAIFLGAATAIIATIVIIRRVIAGNRARGADGGPGGIVFSLEQGEVWASWYGQAAPVNLGSQRKVSEMMEDFLAQVELGERLKRPPR